MKAIGSLFTLAGETLSAIGRMIERPAFNDEAAEQFLGGRWESDGPDAADALADIEERVEVFEPRKCSTNNSAAAMESGYDIAANLAAAFELFPQHKTSVAHPVAATEGPNPATPPTGLGHQTSECPGCYDFACPGPHPTSPGASSVSQPAAAAVPGESVGATDSNFGGGADRPLSEVLGEAATLLDRLATRAHASLSDVVTLSYVNDALMLAPELRDIAAQLRDTE